MRRPSFAALAGAAVITMLATGSPAPAAGMAPAQQVRLVTASDNPLTTVGGFLVIAAGDIACAPGSPVTATRCRQKATARLAQSYQPRHAFALGDTQYDTGSLTAYRNSYAKSWGALKSITKPIPGNHEYRTRGASGYYRYFRNQIPGGAPGYYAFNVGNWRIYALNSNCRNINCRREARWLARDMTRNPRRCSAILLHHPRYSSGYEHGDSPEGRRFWRIGLRHNTDLALAGHDHNYERFRRMDASGNVSRTGIRSWVVGTGGKSLYSTRGLREGSAVFDNHRAGVLALKLGTKRYGWQYQTIDGKVVDSGISRCR